MNVYEIENPKDGQRATDDVYGPMVYNATDGTWDLDKSNPANVLDNAGNWISTKLGFKTTTSEPGQNGFFEKYSWWLLGGGVVVLAYMLMTMKKKK